MLTMSIQNANFEDLYRVYYLGTAGPLIVRTLKGIRSGNLHEDELNSFPLRDHIGESSALLFSPVMSLLRFYGLLEIALLSKFIPEPDYMNEFWKDAGENLNLLLSNSNTTADNYPTILPQFLMGRLEGRMHLEEEGVDVRYGELSSIVLSFSSLVSRWRDPDIEALLRFALTRDADHLALETLTAVVGAKDQFMARILIAQSDRTEALHQLLQGLSETLSLCEDIDRLLEDAKPFPLVQSAMWTYHADLFSALDRRLPSYLIHVVESFASWVSNEPQSQRAAAISNYIENAKAFLGRLSSGAYGGALHPEVLRPMAPVLA
jgi:hypothetical protein